MRHGDGMFNSAPLRFCAVILGLSCVAAPLSAADAEQFDSYTRGRTIHFDFLGQHYGAERYLPGQRVQWSFLDGRCVEGEWYAQGDEICFVYEDRPEAQCWSYEIGSEGLSVTITGDGPALTLTEQPDPPKDMVCLGPEVGV